MIKNEEEVINFMIYEIVEEFFFSNKSKVNVWENSF